MRTDKSPRFGLVLPHFGSDPDPGRLLKGARMAEELGFDSVWVRDRLASGAPHGLLMEAGGTVFLEPLLTLAAVAAVTDRITLGTAVLVPNRHPLRLIQEVGTLWKMAEGRLAMGLGLGVGPKNFEPLGLDYGDRRGLFHDTVEALRSPASFLSELEVDPAPGRGVALYYGGVSKAAVRRAYQYTDGWIAGRLPRDTFLSRVQLARRFEAETGRRLDIASMPITLVDSGDGRHLDAARAAVETLARSAEGARDWIKPLSGRFETVDDLAGLLITGTADQCRRQTRRMVESGVTNVIFDLRLVFEDFEYQIHSLSKEVISGL